MKRAFTFLLVTIMLLVMELACGLGCSSRTGGDTYSADLSGGSETPPVTTPMLGHVDITFNTARTQADFKITIVGGVGVSSAELHLGTENVSGPIVAVLFNQPAGLDVNGTVVEATLTDHSLLGEMASLAALESAITQGKIYCNVHTLANPIGAIRGQIH